MNEVRDELERLRDDGKKPVIRLTSDGDECALPFMIPEMSDALIVSDSMHTLVATAVSQFSKQRVGFWGSGGIGKTTTSAWLCRQEPVRRYFSTVAWVSLGQTPNIVVCQRSLYTQLTGAELPLDLSADEKLEKIRSAFIGRDCLLVLDDVWEMDHIASFTLIDESTKSKVLMSSRVRSTLDGCEVVDIGLPTEEDAIQIVMAAAGIAGTPPPQAREVVRLCKLLPLTVGIAGRMVKDLDLQQDWSEVTTMMRDELSVDGEARSAEDTVIATSLRAISGPHAESAQALLRAFRLVPEDVQCPLEALQCVYAASTDVEADQRGGSSDRPPLLQIYQLRKITKMLIDRCLLLGPIDQPSVHDIVGEYAEAMSSDDMTQNAHRRLVDIFRERRPDKNGWDVGHSDDRLTKYIQKHAGFHIEAGWWKDSWQSDHTAISWLDECNDSPVTSQDAIPLAAAEFLGTERVSQLAKQAESAGDFWTASLRWSATALVNRSIAGHEASVPLLKACSAALEKCKPSTSQQQVAKERLEIPTLVMILQAWDPADAPVLMPRLGALRDSQASKENMERAADVFLMVDVYPEFFGRTRKGLCTPEELLFGQYMYTFSRMFADAAQAELPGSGPRNRYLSLAFSFNIGLAFLDLMTETLDHPRHKTLETFSWDLAFGNGGCLLVEASETYDFDKMHRYCVAKHSCDGNIRPNIHTPLAFHWGDLESANACVDRGLSGFKRLLMEATPDAATAALGISEWPSSLYMLGRHADAAEFLRQCKADWENADKTYAELTERLPIMGRMEDQAFWSTVDFAWNCKMLYVLVSDDMFTAEQVLAGLPEAEDLANVGVYFLPDGTRMFHPAHFNGKTSLVWPALALEKLGQYEKALAYANKALDKDQTQGGSPVAWQYSLAHRCRGRILAAAGQMDNARDAFEAALSCIALRGYWLFEALAVHDLNEHVLKPSGELRDGAEHRLAPMLQKLVSPAESLEALLQRQPGPCDKAAARQAVQSISVKVATPQPSAQGSVSAVVYEAEDKATDLRREYEGLQLKELRKRAKDAGMLADALDQAMDSDAPKEELIAFLIRQQAASADSRACDAALLSELQALRLKELRKRAKDVGATGEELDAAMDEDEPNDAVIQLILALRESVDDQSSNREELKLKLLAELQEMRLKDLRKRAKKDGISDDALDSAMDADEPEAAVIELIVSLFESASADRLHFGSAKASSQPERQVAANTKHVMLSYQWDHQSQVTQVYDALTRLGVKCWMDISGGMGSDIYESMAEGVSNASVVVCFMSQKCKYRSNIHPKLGFPGGL